jgi:hypothetical protein
MYLSKLYPCIPHSKACTLHSFCSVQRQLSIPKLPHLHTLHMATRRHNGRSPRNNHRHIHVDPGSPSCPFAFWEYPASYMQRIILNCRRLASDLLPRFFVHLPVPLPLPMSMGSGTQGTVYRLSALSPREAHFWRFSVTVVTQTNPYPSG